MLSSILRRYEQNLKPKLRSCRVLFYFYQNHNDPQPQWCSLVFTQDGCKPNLKPLQYGNETWEARKWKIHIFMQMGCKTEFTWMLCVDLPGKLRAYECCSEPGSFLSAVETSFWRGFFFLELKLRSSARSPDNSQGKKYAAYLRNAYKQIFPCWHIYCNRWVWWWYRHCVICLIPIRFISNVKTAQAHPSFSQLLSAHWKTT